MVKSKPARLLVGVYDERGRTISNAEVVATRGKDRRSAKRLPWSASIGAYVQRELLSGEYLIRVSHQSARQERPATIQPGAEAREVFVVGPPGLPTILRGRVEVPFALPGRIVAAVIAPENARDMDIALRRIARDAGLRRVRPPASSAELLRLYRIPERNEVRDEAVLEAFEAAGVRQAGIVVKRHRSSITFLTRDYAVRFRDGAPDSTAQAYAKRWGLSVRRRVPYAGAAFAMRWNHPASLGLLERCAEAARDDGILFAEPILSGTCQPDDPAATASLLFGLQWHLRQVGCPDAWEALGDAVGKDRGFGDPDIVIAIMDGGVDLSNGDLGGVVSDGRPKLHQVFDFTRMLPDNDERHDVGHGTRCAGIALARGGDGSGVTGAAPNCRLMALRTPGVAPSPVASELDFADAYVWAAGLDPHSSREGFPAQLQRGADIISSSFAGPTKDLPISGLMKETFDHLTDNGRGGRGTLLFFSSGTFYDPREVHDLTLRRPWAAYERTFAIGASTLGDDGLAELHPDYSGYGGLALLDLTAPSHDGGNPALDAPSRFATVTADDVGRGQAPRAAIASTRLTAAALPGSTITTLAVADNAGFPLYGWALFDFEELTRVELLRIVAVPTDAPTVLRVRGMREAHPAGAPVIYGPSDCTLAFGGTSSSTPLCAGVAALVLSARPDLGWSALRDLLRRTASRVDPATTDEVGGWIDGAGRRQGDAAYEGPRYSRWYGFGRVDAVAAVREALRDLPA